jgi:hypothetical protein
MVVESESMDHHYQPGRELASLGRRVGSKPMVSVSAELLDDVRIPVHYGVMIAAELMKGV